MAIVDSVKHSHNYIYGSKCMVRTDHGSLVWLMRFSNPVPNGQVARDLSLYDISIKYRPGRLNSNADAMSRIPCNGCNHCTKQETLDAQVTEKESVTPDPCRKMTLRSNSQAVAEDDTNEESPLSSTWVTMKTPRDLRDSQLNNSIIKIRLEMEGK